MKKCLILIFFGLCSFHFLNAQSISLSAVVPEGEVSETENISLEWTIGEVITHTVHHEKGTLTQGSQQPVLHVDLMELRTQQSTLTKTDIQIYPNPVERMLTVRISSDEPRTLKVFLIDSNGKRLLKTTGNAVSDQLELDLGSLPDGLYFLRFEEKDGDHLQTYQIAKVND